MCLIVVYTTDMIQQQNQISQKIRQCPVCNRTIQIAYSEYCIGCSQELRAIILSSSSSKEKGVSA
jgi:hypothetical protein